MYVHKYICVYHEFFKKGISGQGRELDIISLKSQAIDKNLVASLGKTWDVQKSTFINIAVLATGNEDSLSWYLYTKESVFLSLGLLVPKFFEQKLKSMICPAWKNWWFLCYVLQRSPRHTQGAASERAIAAAQNNSMTISMNYAPPLLRFPIVQISTESLLFCNGVTHTKKPSSSPNMCICKLLVQAPWILGALAGALEKVTLSYWRKSPLWAKGWSSLRYGAKLANEQVKMNLTRGCECANEENITMVN